MHIVGLSGSPKAGGSTERILKRSLELGRQAGAKTVELQHVLTDYSEVYEALSNADILVLGSPVYRGSISGVLKSFLDGAPRIEDGESSSPLQGLPTVLAMSGASPAHYLSTDSLRSFLASCFAAWVVPPGIYVTDVDWEPDGSLGEPAESHLARQLQAAVVLAGLEPEQRAQLRAVRPQL